MQRHDVAGGEVATAMRIIGSIGSREFGQEAVQGSVVVAAATGWPASFTVAGGQLCETGWRNRVLLPVTSGSVQLACAWDVVYVADSNTLHELRHVHSDQPQHHKCQLDGGLKGLAATEHVVVAVRPDGGVLWRGSPSQLFQDTRKTMHRKGKEDDEDVDDENEEEAEGDEDYSLPNLVPLGVGVAVAAVACGKLHICLLARQGDVYTMGHGAHGQLGHGNIDTIRQPRPMEALQGVLARRVACGGWHTLVLADTGDVYSCGRSDKGQLGRDVDATPASVPGLVEVSGAGMSEEPHFVEVAAGSAHSLALTRDGALFGWGWGAHGQLGVDALLDSEHSMPMPARVAVGQNVFVESIVSSACAWHSLLLGAVR